MRRLFMRVLALGFAITVLFGLVAHATLTSGCSKPEPVAREPDPASNAQAAPTLASAPAPASTPTTVVTPAATASADTPVVKAVTTPEAKPQTKPATKPGGKSAPPSQNANPPPSYFGGSKSGVIFRPSE